MMDDTGFLIMMLWVLRYLFLSIALVGVMVLAMGEQPNVIT
jgi:hypothetical protein